MKILITIITEQNFLNVIVTLILILSDSFWYGYVYEIKGWLKRSLFKVWKPGKEPYVPFYRLLVQWPLDLIALYLVWLQGWKPFIGMLIAWYLMIKEGGYYVVLGQWGMIDSYSKLIAKQSSIENENTYWLKRFFFAGKWIFPTYKFDMVAFTITDYGFRRTSFGWSCIFGLIILLLSNFI